MANATVYIYITTKSGTEWELEVEAEGHVSHGGSNSYGSDEPEWTEVEDVELTSPVTGRKLGKRITNAITARQWDYITDLLIESDSNW